MEYYANEFGDMTAKTISFYDTMDHAVPKNHKNSNQAVDDHIASEFTKLSVNDRTVVANEIDGTHCMAIEENLEMLKSALLKLERELKSIPFKKKVGYIQSQKLQTTHINDVQFRLRFLRSQFFDERQAAMRLVKYCDFVLELFGSFALKRHVTLNDFSKHELKWMMKGYVQLMPFRDQSGRRVILQIMDSNVMQEQITRLKIAHYMSMVASEDIESQKKGVVLVVWPGGNGKDWKTRQSPDARALHLLRTRHEVLPMRFAGYHYCMPENPIFRLIRSFALLFVGMDSGLKNRMRFHIGMDTELRYTLQGYGIPVDFIPVTGTGNIKLNFLKQCIHIRKIIETEVELSATTGRPFSESIVECPGSNDVVFKPGKRLICHPGNALFQELILSKAKEYTTTSSKRGLYRSLIREIKVKREGLFLSWCDGGYWTEVRDESQIIIKISTSCKAVLKKSSRAGKNAKLVNCSTSAFQNNVDIQTLCEDDNSKNKRKRCDDVVGAFPCAPP